MVPGSRSLVQHPLRSDPPSLQRDTSFFTYLPKRPYTPGMKPRHQRLDTVFGRRRLGDSGTRMRLPKKLILEASGERADHQLRMKREQSTISLSPRKSFAVGSCSFWHMICRGKENATDAVLRYCSCRVAPWPFQWTRTPE